MKISGLLFQCKKVSIVTIKFITVYPSYGITDVFSVLFFQWNVVNEFLINNL